jgi:hypothetical protein
VLRLDGFAHDALMEESSQLGVAVDDLAVFAILYYLADLDSNRIARRIPAATRSLAGGDIEGHLKGPTNLGCKS